MSLLIKVNLPPINWHFNVCKGYYSQSLFCPLINLFSKNLVKMWINFLDILQVWCLRTLPFDFLDHLKLFIILDEWGTHLQYLLWSSFYKYWYHLLSLRILEGCCLQFVFRLKWNCSPNAGVFSIHKCIYRIMIMQQIE